MADPIERKWVEFTDWSDGEYGAMPAHLASEHAYTGSNVLRYESGLLGPRAGVVEHTIGPVATGIVFAANNLGPDTITRSTGSFVTDGFVDGQTVVVSGFATPANNGTFLVATVTATTLTMDAAVTLTDEAAGATVSITAPVSGTLWALFYIGVADTGALAVVIDDGVYLTDNDTDFTLTLIDTLAATPTIPVCFTMYDPNTQVYLTNLEDATYCLSVTGQTLTQILNKGGIACFLWKDRLYVMGVRDETPPAGPWTVFYSDAAAFSTFAGSFMSLGYHWDGYAFAAIGNNLFMGTRSEGWWALTGGSPDTGTLRLLHPGDAPHKQQCVVTEHGMTWFWREGYDGATGIDLEAGTAKLGAHNGSVWETDEWAHLELAGERFGVFSGRHRHVVFISDTDQGVIRSYGAWSYHDFDVDLTGHVCDTNTSDRVVLGGEVGDTVHKFYSLDLSLNRPGFVSDGRAGPGDASDACLDAHFSTKLWLHPSADEVAVRRVVVEFVKWDTGAVVTEVPQTNHMDIVVSTYGRNGNAGFDDETIAWDEAADQATTSGVEDRISKNFGANGFGGGFQIRVENMRGVAIRRIVVEYQDNAPRIDAA